jgi:ubiquinone/menaquinone biosynthesis C-methylase UbiE
MTTSANVPMISTKWVRLFHFIYDHVLSKLHDVLQLHMLPLKKIAVDELHLKRGDRVILFCCGTGQELPFIRERIGPEGEILGIDWSDGMLDQARRKIASNGWTNVKLVKGDVTALPECTVGIASYDAGMCTLGLSIINQPENAFQGLKNAVKGGGRIVIGDVCSFSGLKSILNPFNTLIDLTFGNTHRSLTHSRIFAEALPSDLLEAKLKWHLGGSYYIASGRRSDV